MEKRLITARKDSEKAVLQINKMRSEAPILLSGGERQRYTQGAITQMYPGIAIKCPVPVRRWNFDFPGGNGTNDIDVPFVEGVTDGFVGWRNVPSILNSGTDEAITSHLWLNWYRAVPLNGTYSYRFAAPEARLKLNHTLWGNGLWGTDATLKIDIYTWVSAGNATLEGYTDTLVNESKSAWGSTQGTIDEWIPVGTNGMFRAPENTPCRVTIQLQIQHWSSDKGAVSVNVEDFWYPSANPDMDIAMTD